MASLEFLLDLLPLSMCIEVEAIICIKRFKYLGHYRAFSDYFSRKNLDAEILEHPLLNMPCDGMPVRYVFDKSYHILALTRNDWSTVPVHSGRKCSAWYTDGSKIDKGISACCPNEHLRYF